jgi:DAK2 domain fusion protein YloV
MAAPGVTGSPDVMDGEVVRRWFTLAVAALDGARSAIDRLNVFPVPDSDTGTNLHVTLAQAEAAIAGLSPLATQAEVWQAAASGALLGACGNSGIIVSQLLRGLADTCGPAVPCDGPVVARGLGHGAAAARAAVRRPVEGTVLTVAEAAALAAARESGLAAVGRAAAVGAREALSVTQQQITALAAAGVVDAGGAGLCILLDALSAAISGTAPGGYLVPAPEAGRPAPAELAASDFAAGQSAYEATFLIEADETAMAGLREDLDRLGDSLVVSGGGSQWHVHVHVDDAGAAIEAGLAAGRLSKITVTYLKGPRGADASAAHAGLAAGQVVAVAEGAGLVQLLREGGATVLSADPELLTSELATLTALAGPRILVIASDDRGRTRSLAGLWPQGWPVIEAGSAIGVLAALAVHDPDHDVMADAASMSRAAAGVRLASVELADDPREPGGAAVLGRVGRAVAVAGSSQAEVACEVISALLAPGAELVTLLTGQAAAADLAVRAAERAAEVAPAAEVMCLDGGMPGAVLLIGAE